MARRRSIALGGALLPFFIFGFLALSVCFVFLFIFLLMVRFMEAYILIKLRSGVDLEGVLKEVRSKMGVKKASLVFGPFDL